MNFEEGLRELVTEEVQKLYPVMRQEVMKEFLELSTVVNKPFYTRKEVAELRKLSLSFLAKHQEFYPSDGVMVRGKLLFPRRAVIEWLEKPWEQIEQEGKEFLDAAGY